MKYIVIGDTAILATRDIENIDAKIPVVVDGVTEDATLSVSADGIKIINSKISSGRCELDAEELKEGRYYVNVSWRSFENDSAIEHIAIGCPFTVFNKDDGVKAIMPAPQASAIAVDRMWKGIVNILETVMADIDSLKNGNDVI